MIKELELTYMNDEIKARLEKYLEGYYNLEQIKNYRNSDRYKDLPFNPFFAKWK